MGRRLALLADRSHNSPWTRASGVESAVRVKGLGVDDIVMLIVKLPDSELAIKLNEGVTLLLDFFPHEWEKYMIKKSAGATSVMTTVEVLLG